MVGPRVAVVAAAIAALAGTISAADQPIGAVQLVLQREAAGREKLLFVSKDPGFLFPAVGGPDDPGTGSPGGALLELFAGTGESAALSVPPGADWTARTGRRQAHRFTNRSSVVTSVVLKEGRLLKVRAHATGLALGATQGSVAVRMTTGSLRNCAYFDAPTIRRDQANRFVARGAVAGALADCSGGPFSTTTSTTTTSTTTTTVAGVCGDGVVNQPSENCDGMDPGLCDDVPFPFACEAPGQPDECQCCAVRDCVLFVGAIMNCCGDARCIDQTGVGQVRGGTCIPFTCTEGPDCGTAGYDCVGGHCCALPGAFCAGIECCPGMNTACGPFFGSSLCCLPQGGACSFNEQCCSGTCGGTSTCD
jgi:hypothetical protein